MGVDEKSGLVRRAELTPAKVYESEVADGLVLTRAVYADRAYESKIRRKWLKSGHHRTSIKRSFVATS